MTVRRMYRYQVVVNDRPQLHDVRGDPRHVEASRLGVGVDALHLVEFWVEHDPAAARATRAFQVFGTGHPLPDGARYWGTTARTPEGLVWHLFEVPVEAALTGGD